MTAATITELLTDVHDPTVEEVILEASNGETYVSKKFGKVRHAMATFLEDMEAHSIPISCVVSGRTVTIHSDSITDKAIALRLRGLK